MAATLAKLMSRLCLSQQSGPLNLKLSKSVASSTGKLCNRSYSVWQAERQQSFSPVVKNPESNRLLQCQPTSHVAVRSVTYEIKQWREHRVINRFYRLHWGGWIRCRGGRFRRLYRKTPKDRWKLQQHIFCNKTQNRLLDRLVLPHWKEPKHFVDSPYEAYHTRTNFPDFPTHKKFYP